MTVIYIDRRKTDRQKHIALNLALESSLKKLRAKARADQLSLEGQMLLAIVDHDDNTQALDIKARIERRNSWK